MCVLVTWSIEVNLSLKRRNTGLERHSLCCYPQGEKGRPCPHSTIFSPTDCRRKRIFSSSAVAVSEVLSHASAGRKVVHSLVKTAN